MVKRLITLGEVTRRPLITVLATLMICFSAGCASPTPTADEGVIEPRGSEQASELCPGGLRAPDGELMHEANGQGSADYGADGVSLISEVRLGAQCGFERIVFEFADAVPNYRIFYNPLGEDPPVTTEGDERPIWLVGDASLVVAMAPTRMPGSDEPEFRSAPEFVGGACTSLVSDVVYLGPDAFETYWAAGVRSGTRFSVAPAENPPRLIIDIVGVDDVGDAIPFGPRSVATGGCPGLSGE